MTDRKIVIDDISQMGLTTWAGDGRVTDEGVICDCTADLRAHAYDAIEAQIASGLIGGQTHGYSWAITEGIS